jgi:hypothetical protein
MDSAAAPSPASGGNFAVQNSAMPEKPSVFTPERPQFRLATLFVGTTVAALLLAVLSKFGIWGAVLAFLAAAVYSAVHQLSRLDTPGRRFAFDLVWGTVLPLVCLLCDPILFQNRVNVSWDPLSPHDNALFHEFNLTPWALGAYAGFGMQMAILAAWLFAGPVMGKTSALFSGGLAVGSAMSIAAGIAILPYSLIGSLMLGLGLPGLTPFFTAYVFIRRMREAWKAGRSRLRGWQFFALFAAGALIAAALPLAVWYLADLGAIPQMYLIPGRSLLPNGTTPLPP